MIRRFIKSISKPALNGIGHLGKLLHGPLRIGSLADYITIASDGLMTFAGNSRVKKHITIEASALKVPGANPPGAAVVGNFSVLQFTGVGATVEQVFFEFHIPVDMDLTENLSVHIHWAPSTAAAGNVKWQLDWVAINSGELLTAGVTSTSVVDATTSTQDELQESDDMTIASASLSAEDVIGIRIYRDPADVADTYAADASLVFVEFEYVSDKLGEDSVT